MRDLFLNIQEDFSDFVKLRSDFPEYDEKWDEIVYQAMEDISKCFQPEDFCIRIVKSKFNQLRIQGEGITTEIHDIICYYEDLANNHFA